MTTSPAEIDSLLRVVNREVWIVTAAANERRGGLTATWVAQASIDPQRPVILAGLAPNHFTAQLVKESGMLVAHLLTESQGKLAWDFARDSGRSRDKLDGVATSQSPAGLPVIEMCMAWFECRVFAHFDAGDRWFFWADVVAAEKRNMPTEPLREHALMNSLNENERKVLIESRERDIAIQRLLHETWRNSLPPGEQGA